jgi:trk system potassium uptake protein TrkA
MKSFCVIGLGRFGASVVKTLVKNGHEVVAIDTDLRKLMSSRILLRMS